MLKKPIKWEYVVVTCWNYLKGCLGGISTNVEIDASGCLSDCENNACPLHKDSTV